VTREKGVTDIVTLRLPRERDFFGVAHLVLGGLAARAELTYDVLDDVTTALDELLVRREATEDVTLSVRIEDGVLSATVGPFSGAVAADLQAPAEGLGLRRVLETMVDDVTLSERDGAQWIELRKATGDGG
jgi:anti-sigma regulatory factor (Ser/Thr protein kinase)